MNYEGLTDRELWQLLFQKTEAEMAVYMRGLDQLPRSELIMAADEISAMATCRAELMALGETSPAGRCSSCCARKNPWSF